MQAEGISAAVNVGTVMPSKSSTDTSVSLKGSAFRLSQNLSKTLAIMYSLLESDIC